MTWKKKKKNGTYTQWRIQYHLGRYVENNKNIGKNTYSQLNLILIYIFSIRNLIIYSIKKNKF